MPDGEFWTYFRFITDKKLLIGTAKSVPIFLTYSEISVILNAGKNLKIRLLCAKGAVCEAD